MEVSPNQTLYVHNLNEKLKKDVLKKLLYMIFSQYGKVKQITACKGIKLRGQAWVAFKDVSSAINAMKGKQGFMFYDKPLKIGYAKADSKVVAKKDTSDDSKAKPNTAKRSREETTTSDEVGTGEPPTKEARTVVTNTVPNKILFAQNLPTSCVMSTLNGLFEQCPGFVEVRMAGTKGVAFIEFQNEVQSGMALRQLGGIQLSETDTLQLTYSS